MRWVSLILWMTVCLAVGAVSGRWTATEIPGWYRTLTHPAIAPPNWVFAPVWTMLYVLMAVAAWRVAETAALPVRNLATGLFVAQLALNFCWSLIFFRSHAIGWALVEVLALWAAIAASMALFWQVDRVAAWLMAPYLAWVSFASVLNFAFWRLNPR